MKRLICFLLFPFLLLSFNLSCVTTPKRESDPYGGLAIPMKKQDDKVKKVKEKK